MPIELAIFDLDGTLIDSMGDLADSMNAVLSDLGHPVHPRDAYRFMVGDGIVKLVQRALPAEAVADADISEVVQKMRNEYSTRWTATTRPYPEIPTLLTELDRRQILSCVLSNKPDGPTRKIVGELFPDTPFAIVRGALDGVPLKPDPTAALALIADLEIDASRTVFIGDTSIDMETGRRAGLRRVGVTWGFRDADELVDSGAEDISDHPLRILDILETWNAEQSRNRR